MGERDSGGQDDPRSLTETRGMLVDPDDRGGLEGDTGPASEADALAGELLGNRELRADREKDQRCVQNQLGGLHGRLLWKHIPCNYTFCD
jgi:hypothetical protein